MPKNDKSNSHVVTFAYATTATEDKNLHSGAIKKVAQALASGLEDSPDGLTCSFTYSHVDNLVSSKNYTHCEPGDVRSFCDDFKSKGTNIEATHDDNAMMVSKDDVTKKVTVDVKNGVMGFTAPKKQVLAALKKHYGVEPVAKHSHKI